MQEIAFGGFSAGSLASHHGILIKKLIFVSFNCTSLYTIHHENCKTDDVLHHVECLLVY